MTIPSLKSKNMYPLDLNPSAVNGMRCQTAERPVIQVALKTSESKFDLIKVLL